MPVCIQCQQFMAQEESRQGLCSNCQPPPSDEDHWSSIARVPNLAEAGYLVSLLEHQQMEARLRQNDSFSAETGSWTSDFILQVPSGQRLEAAELIRSEAEALRGEQPELDEFGEPIDDWSLRSVIWKPVALMALAGLATLWLGQRVAEQRARNTPQRATEALTQAISAIGRPMIAVSPNGKVSHRLTYWADRQIWLLESDTNHDGRFDRKQAFAMAAQD